MIDPALGAVEVLSQNEQIRLFACEEVIASGWNTFVQVGLALAEIRKGELYRAEFDSFEQYCKLRWQYGRNYVDRLISAAQVVRCLMTNCHQQPEHEGQVRPLVGLTPEQAQAAWQFAVERAASKKVTQRLVQTAVQGVTPTA